MEENKFRVRMFLGEQLLNPDEYKNVIIVSPAVDKIVNSICEESYSSEMASSR